MKKGREGVSEDGWINQELIYAKEMLKQFRKT